jgi:membrane carboxypeptidase/penicillin-binding protein
MVPSPRGIPAKGQRRSLQRWFKGLLAVMGSTGIFVLAMAGTAAYVLYRHVAEDLPELSLLNISPPSLITTLDADDGSTMAHLFVERRLLVQ